MAHLIHVDKIGAYQPTRTADFTVWVATPEVSEVDNLDVNQIRLKETCMKTTCGSSSCAVHSPDVELRSSWPADTAVHIGVGPLPLLHGGGLHFLEGTVCGSGQFSWTVDVGGRGLLDFSKVPDLSLDLAYTKVVNPHDHQNLSITLQDPPLKNAYNKSNTDRPHYWAAI
jgi:hypothetical protein